MFIAATHARRTTVPYGERKYSKNRIEYIDSELNRNSSEQQCVSLSFFFVPSFSCMLTATKYITTSFFDRA